VFALNILCDLIVTSVALLEDMIGKIILYDKIII